MRYIDIKQGFDVSFHLFNAWIIKFKDIALIFKYEVIMLSQQS